MKKMSAVEDTNQVILKPQKTAVKSSVFKNNPAHKTIVLDAVERLRNFLKSLELTTFQLTPQAYGKYRYNLRVPKDLSPKQLEAIAKAVGNFGFLVTKVKENANLFEFKLQPYTVGDTEDDKNIETI